MVLTNANIKTIAEIITNDNDFFIFNNLLVDNKIPYFAHKRADEYESLSDHLSLTLKYLIKLVNANKIDKILDNIIFNFVNLILEKEDIITIPSNKEELMNFAKEMFVKAIYFHDFGKINENFQIKKMKNKSIKKRPGKSVFGSNHSLISYYLYLAYYVNLICKGQVIKDKAIEKYFIVLSMLYAYNVLKHHSRLADVKKIPDGEELVQAIEEYIDRLSIYKDFNIDLLINLINKRKDIYLELVSSLSNYFEIFVLIKLNFSLLIASDYYSTSDFMLNFEYNDFGVIDEEFKKRLIDNFYSIPYNNKIITNYNSKYYLSPIEVTSHSNKGLNLLRQSLAIEVLKSINKRLDKRLFYIEAPTGSGKTNMSFLALTELLKIRKDITKVFYVFPFITLIDQTFDFAKSKLKLNNLEITRIHSKAPFYEDVDKAITSSEPRDEEDAVYDDKKQVFINYTFINYPICFISHITFFNILVSTNKDRNYLLHRLANSIVIIDEIQSYTPHQWDKINYLINNYSKCLNITFIIMSATLPKISKLMIDEKKSEDNFTYLITNSKDYYQHPIFAKRVDFVFDHLKEKIMKLDQLATIVYDNCEELFKSQGRIKAIIEFVTKKSAFTFYSLVKENNNFSDYKILLLTGTILEPRRREIINLLKAPSSQNNKLLLVTTQVIEAGLDVDMDLGFKDRAIVDAEEQLAGRINRNCSKKKAKLILFDTRDRYKTYGNDVRHKLDIDDSLYKKILAEKLFDNYYQLVFQKINDKIKDPFLADNLIDFKEQFLHLRFNKINRQFELIKNDTITIYVPLSIDCNHFDETELSFLKTFDNFTIIDNKISGRNVWTIYTEIVTKRKNFSFIDKNIRIKTISSIISKFIFSLWSNEKLLAFLSNYGYFRLGYFYLEKYEEIYSYIEGFKMIEIK